jgi:hypothetical protein
MPSRVATNASKSHQKLITTPKTLTEMHTLQYFAVRNLQKKKSKRGLDAVPADSPILQRQQQMQREVRLTDAPGIRKWQIAIAMAMAEALPSLGFGEQRKEDRRTPRETHAHGHASWHGMT